MTVWLGSLEICKTSVFHLISRKAIFCVHSITKLLLSTRDAVVFILMRTVPRRGRRDVQETKLTTVRFCSRSVRKTHWVKNFNCECRNFLQVQFCSISLQKWSQRKCRIVCVCVCVCVCVALRKNGTKSTCANHVGPNQNDVISHF